MGRPVKNRIMESGSRLVVNLGLPGLGSTRCTFDKIKGTAEFASRTLLLRVTRQEIPLSSIASLYIRRRRRALSKHYEAVLGLRARGPLRIASRSHGEASKAIRAICAFLDLVPGPAPAYISETPMGVFTRHH